jgi:ppGpp synthetase/RelA/SpoT-type nucleotidyltranferase
MAGPKLNQRAFFEKYKIKQTAWDRSGLSWSELEAIYADYLERIGSLEPTAGFISERLRKLDVVHSLKYRIKDPEHLIEKIIRKQFSSGKRTITPENYSTLITDLIGVRAIHLFKGDWERIHDFIGDTWKLKELPTANVRKGDSADLIKLFRSKGCKIHEHEFGYRSVHYLVKSQPTKNLFVAELQVRTIFE